MNFDSFINAIIPWVIIIFSIFLLYRPLKEPIDLMFSTIGNLFGWGKEKVSSEDEFYKNITYE